MKTFAQYLIEMELLLEDRIKFLKKEYTEFDLSHEVNFPGPIGSHFRHADADEIQKEGGVAKGAIAAKIIDHFAKMDPTWRKKHTQWLLNQYKRQNIRMEDGARIRQTLNNFKNTQQHLTNKDINSYKHIADLDDAMEPWLKVKSKRAEEEEVKHEGADLVHNEDGLKVYSVKTREAACQYGKGTKWCTAMDSSSHHYDHYSKLGPIYVIIMPDKSKWQFQFESRSFFDANDRQYDLADILKRKEMQPLRKVKVFKDKSIHFQSGKELHAYIDKLLDADAPNYSSTGQLREALRHPDLTPTLITKALKHTSDDVKFLAIEHPNLTADHITWVLNNGNNQLRRRAMYHENATAENIMKALDDQPDPDVRKTAINRTDITTKHIDKALNDEDHIVRETAIQSKKATAKHIEKVIDRAVANPNGLTLPIVGIAMIHNKEKFTQGMIDKMASIDSPELLRDIIGADVLSIKLVRPEYLTKALGYGGKTAYMAILHPNVSVDTITKALQNPDKEVRMHALMKRPTNVLRPGHVAMAFNDPDPDVREMAEYARSKMEQSDHRFSVHNVSALLKKLVHVKAHVKGDGTEVHSYTRSPPME